MNGNILSVIISAMMWLCLLLVIAIIGTSLYKEMASDNHAIMLESIDANRQLDTAIAIIQNVQAANVQQAKRIADLEDNCGE